MGPLVAINTTRILLLILQCHLLSIVKGTVSTVIKVIINHYATTLE